jgi:hypothetical protein
MVLSGSRGLFDLRSSSFVVEETPPSSSWLAGDRVELTSSCDELTGEIWNDFINQV